MTLSAKLVGRSAPASSCLFATGWRGTAAERPAHFILTCRLPSASLAERRSGEASARAADTF